jgi:serine/threonine protein phosphatase PrpC
MKFSHYSATNVGLVRKANEDSFGDIACQNGAHAYAVCDGMGGHVGGATASQMAVKCILEFLAKADMTDCEFAIRQACNYANTQVFATASNDSSLQGMGTTCVVLVIKGDYCYFGHVGDSRLYLYTNKELHRLTRDQSYVQMLVDSGELSDDLAETHPKKNQILQAIGISEEIAPKTCELRISPKKGDKLLLCTDGLNGMMNDKVIASAFRNNDSLKSCAENLIQLALDNGGRDNVTVSLVEITESTHVSSLFKSENPVPSAPGTEMFPVPKKAMNWKSFYKKYKIHVIASSAAICVLVVSLLLMRPTEESKTREGTPNTKEETTTGVEVTAPANNEVKAIEEQNTQGEGSEGDKGDKNKESTGKTGKTHQKGDTLEFYTVKPNEVLTTIMENMKKNYKDCDFVQEKIVEDNQLNNANEIAAGRKLIIICHKN